MTKLDSDFYHEEIRCDYLVTEKQKKIWAVELEILSLFDEICRRHNLSYFVGYGTLLGAVRHQGFIPWDDDLDIIMFRPDYEKLKLIIHDELPEFYFFQDVYTDSIVSAFSKIRDERTTAIELKYCENAAAHQGIFVDIFPLDGCYPPETTNIELIEKEIWTSITNPDLIQKIINTPEYPANLTRDILKDLISMPLRDRFRQFEAFVAAQFNASPYLGLITSMLKYPALRYPKAWFENTLYLSFEYLSVPVPAEYDKILTTRYKDYHKYVQGRSLHQNIIMDPDKSYLEYYKEWGIV
ncbi:MAG: phosphorylcholine transferase LicD [Lachnospiraceae bacterium]